MKLWFRQRNYHSESDASQFRTVDLVARARGGRDRSRRWSGWVTVQQRQGAAPVSSIVILETGDQIVQGRLVKHCALLEGSANPEGV